MQHHYWYKQVKAEFPGSAMGGYTRLLHGGHPDGYTEEIPTVVVSGLPPQLVKKFKVGRGAHGLGLGGLGVSTGWMESAGLAGKGTGRPFPRRRAHHL